MLLIYWSNNLIEREKEINKYGAGGEALKRYKNIPSHNLEFGNDLDMMPKV